MSAFILMFSRPVWCRTKNRTWTYFCLLLTKIGVPPSRCVVVEDSVAGVTAAKAAGMTCVGFEGGTHGAPQHSEKLKVAGADVVIDRLDALKIYVE